MYRKCQDFLAGFGGKNQKKRPVIHSWNGSERETARCRSRRFPLIETSGCSGCGRFWKISGNHLNQLLYRKRFIQKISHPILPGPMRQIIIVESSYHDNLNLRGNSFTNTLIITTSFNDFAGQSTTITCQVQFVNPQHKRKCRSLFL